jgi:hypothetical protein
VIPLNIDVGERAEIHGRPRFLPRPGSLRPLPENRLDSFLERSTPLPACRRVVQVLTIEHQTIFEANPTRGLENLECPRCGNSTMMLAEVGVWD